MTSFQPTQPSSPALLTAPSSPGSRPAIEDAYEELVRTRGGQMLAVARRFCGTRTPRATRCRTPSSPPSARIQRFDGHAQLSTWLHRIVVNAALMRIRSRQRRPEQSIEPMLPRLRRGRTSRRTVVSWAESGGDVLERKETRALVRAAIAELPDAYRTVLLMRDIEGLSTREAADLLGASGERVKLRLHRARQALAVSSSSASSTSPAIRRAAAAPRRAAPRGRVRPQHPPAARLRRRWRELLSITPVTSTGSPASLDAAA